MPSINDMLLQILTIIRYPNNKVTFVTKFEKVNHMETLANILESLPLDIQAKIAAMSEEEKEEGVKKYIDRNVYADELTRVSNQALKQFIEAMFPVLNFNQKEKLTMLLSL